jgi:predicted Zn-dependent protease with MMP-like domain
MKTLSRTEFEEIAQRAFDRLPDDFKSRVENVHIAVEDYPAEDVLEGRGFERTSLLGLYQGIPLTKRGVSYGMYPTIPDKISLYQKNIEAYSKDETELEKRIAEVLFHELGHYFGMDEHEIRMAMKRFSI